MLNILNYINKVELNSTISVTDVMEINHKYFLQYQKIFFRYRNWGMILKSVNLKRFLSQIITKKDNYILKVSRKKAAKLQKATNIL